VRQHRTSFQPVWSVESWAKLLIWLALNSGCPADSLAAFTAALDPARSRRLRRLFFSRELEADGVRLQADPADGQVVLQGLEPAASSVAAGPLESGRIGAVLQRVGLQELVVAEPQRWERRDGLLLIPLR
jgi:hypothetical protein